MPAVASKTRPQIARKRKRCPTSASCCMGSKCAGPAAWRCPASGPQYRAHRATLYSWHCTQSFFIGTGWRSPQVASQGGGAIALHLRRTRHGGRAARAVQQRRARRHAQNGLLQVARHLREQRAQAAPQRARARGRLRRGGATAAQRRADAGCSSTKPGDTIAHCLPYTRKAQQPRRRKRSGARAARRCLAPAHGLETGR